MNIDNVYEDIIKGEDVYRPPLVTENRIHYAKNYVGFENPEEVPKWSISFTDLCPTCWGTGKQPGWLNLLGTKCKTCEGRKLCRYERSEGDAKFTIRPYRAPSG